MYAEKLFDANGTESAHTARNAICSVRLRDHARRGWASHMIGNRIRLAIWILKSTIPSGRTYSSTKNTVTIQNAMPRTRVRARRVALPLGAAGARGGVLAVCRSVVTAGRSQSLRGARRRLA